MALSVYDFSRTGEALDALATGMKMLADARRDREQRQWLEQVEKRRREEWEKQFGLQEQTARVQRDWLGKQVANLDATLADQARQRAIGDFLADVDWGAVPRPVHSVTGVSDSGSAGDDAVVREVWEQARKRMLPISLTDLANQYAQYKMQRQLGETLASLRPSQATVNTGNGMTVQLASPTPSGPVTAQPVLDAAGQPIPGRAYLDGHVVDVPVPPAQKPLTPEQMETIQQLRQMLGKADNALQIVSDPKYNVVGPIAGTWLGRGVDWLGTVAGSDDSEMARNKRRALEAFLNELALTKTKYIKGPISEREWPFLFNTGPTLTDQESYWRDALNEYIKWTVEVLNEATKGNGAKSPVGEASSPFLSSPTAPSHTNAPPIFLSLDAANRALTNASPGTVVGVYDAKTGTIRTAVKR